MPLTVHFDTDSHYGHRVSTFLAIGPVWLVQSADNNSAARALWDEVVLTGLTTYDALNLTPDEQVTEMLETIDMHFEELERLRVIGTPFTDRLRDHLTEEGFTVLSECDDGFTASVSAEGS